MKLCSLLLAACLLFTAAACSGAAPDGDNSAAGEPSANPTPSVAAEIAPDDAPPAGDEYPIIISHAFGETVIEKKPERIATISWANQDTPLALGVVPVGFSMANFGPVDSYGNHPWTAARLEELGVTEPNVFQDTDGIDFEALSDARPDVILAAYSGITREEYDLLSQIAPVVAFPRYAYQTYWKEQIVLNATGMGMREAGERYVADLEALIADTPAQYPQLAGKTGAFFWIDATDLSTFYLYFTVDPRAEYLTDLGVAFPDELRALQTDETAFSATLSAENIDLLNGLDIIVAYGHNTLLETLQADPLFGTVPAIQSGAVVFIDSNSELAAASTPGALSIPAVIDEYVARLAAAADKAP
jgi:iron complex transport system substrate-binding protein